MTPSVPSRRLPPPELPGHTWLRALGSGGFADVHLSARSFLRVKLR